MSNNYRLQLYSYYDGSSVELGSTEQGHVTQGARKKGFLEEVAVVMSVEG